MQKFGSKAISLLLGVVVILGMFSFFPVTQVTAVTSGDYNYNVLNDGTARITYYNGEKEIIEIPSEIDGYTVTSISFIGTLLSITIPDSVTSINLRDANLTSIQVSENNPYFSDIDGILFNKDGTELVSYPEDRGVIYTIPDGVTTIGRYAFESCEDLERVAIPDSVTLIDSNAFYNCDNLTSVTIPDSVITIGYEAFQSCSNLADVTIGNSVTTIGDYAFQRCESLTEITLPNSVTKIGGSAFSNCTKLASVTILCNITPSPFNDNPFFACPNIKTLTIGLGAEDLSFLSDWTGFTEINATEDSLYFASRDGILFNKDFTEIVKYPETRGGDYIIPDGITSIGEDAFSNCYDLTGVYIPDSVTSIADSAFFACRNLTKFDIPKTITSINTSTFAALPWTEVVIPDNIISIGIGSFASSQKLERVDIPDSVTSIDTNAFAYCGRLTRVTIPGSVTKISMFAFLGSQNVTIYGYTGSYAETYAAEEDIPFVSIGEFVPTDTNTTTATTTTNTTPAVTTSTTPVAKTSIPTSTDVINLGDINLNGKIGDLSDVISLGKFLGNKTDLTDAQKENANVHSDVGLTSNDLIVLVKLSFGEITIADLPQ